MWIMTTTSTWSAPLGVRLVHVCASIQMRGCSQNATGKQRSSLSLAGHVYDTKPFLGEEKNRKNTYKVDVLGTFSSKSRHLWETADKTTSPAVPKPHGGASQHVCIF